MRIILISLIATGIFYSCQEYPYEEKYYYPNDTLKARILFYNSLGKRSAYNYSPNGNISFIYHWENYNNDGLVIHYDSLENVLSELEYVNNELNGKARYFYPSRNRYVDATYKNNQKEGWAYLYHDTTDSLIKERQFFNQDSLIYSKIYNEYGEVNGSLLPISIEQLESRSDSVLLRVELTMSDHDMIALRIGKMKSMDEFQQAPYQIFSDSLSITHWFKPDSTNDGFFEGILYELVHYELTRDQASGDSLLISNYGGSFNFKFELR